MALVVVGGHTRNIGKTNVMTGLISALQDCAWTAIKITQFGHGICSADGKPCDCATADHRMAITEERDASAGTDTSRYLSAGAQRSVWVRTQQGSLLEAMPGIRRELARAKNVIVESNSILRFLRPDVFLSVLDPAVRDFKGSARRYLDRADAILLATTETDTSQAWMVELQNVLARIPVFRFTPPLYVPAEVASFVDERIQQAVGAKSVPSPIP